jgi:hypothetical protein
VRHDTARDLRCCDPYTLRSAFTEIIKTAHSEGVLVYSHQWISDIELMRENVNPVMRAGRTRWRVENETFNTLKNLDYNLEHNYGHGKKHLSTVFATLMMLVFLVDQMQEHVCALFKAARNTFYSRRALWEEMRALFRYFFLIGF